MRVADISAPNPAESGASCTTTQRPVFATSLHSVSTSRGTRVRRSSTDAETPSSSSRVAARRQSSTAALQATSVICSPLRTKDAFPNGTVYAPSGTSDRPARYSRSGSQKRTGSGSRIASTSRPFASYGFDGITILIPGVWTNCASTASEWNSGLRMPPPNGARIVTWQWYRPRERWRYFPSCGPIWWNPWALKPRNCISATGTMPARARPRDAPMMLASARGASTTRAPPKRSTNPLVVRKTPPSLPTSSPSTMTRGSRSISSVRALLMASTMLRCTSVRLQVEQLGALPKHTLGRVLINVLKDIPGTSDRGCESGLQGRVDLVAELLGNDGLALR